MNAEYVHIVQLLLAVAPAEFDRTAFAMKGGARAAERLATSPPPVPVCVFQPIVDGVSN
jgi:hypothetical protein